VNSEAIKARDERWAAQFNGTLQVTNSRSSLLGLDDIVTYLHPETNQKLQFTVLGIRRCKQGGLRYTVEYFGDDCVEVELGGEEMKDILSERVE
jgi:hypothetical protein